MKEYDAATSPDEKAEALSKALTAIEREGIKSLRDRLMISEKGGVEIAKRVDRLKAHIHSKELTADDERFVRVLSGRAKKHLALAIVDLSSTVGSIAGCAINLVPVPLAAQITSSVLVGVSGGASLVTWGGRYFLVNENPFDETSKNRAMRMLDAGAQAVHALKRRLRLIPIGKKAYSPEMAA
jgi:hypothetical protein